MTISKYNYETLQEKLCFEYYKVYKRFPTKQEASGSKHELIMKVMRLKRIQRRLKHAILNSTKIV